VSGVINERTKSPAGIGAPAPPLSPLTLETAGYAHDLKAVARIIQGDGVFVSPRRRVRFSTLRTGSREQARMVSR
jgi:hypothetical protein